MEQAHTYLTQAVNKDPNFALAWAALADLYALGAPPAPKAREALQRALELDPDLAEAHATLGFIRMVDNWDWPGAEKSFRRSIAADPRYATARQWFALYLALCGRFAEAEAQLQEGLRMDPASVNLLHEHCEVLYLERKYAAALGECRKVLEIDPVFRFAKATVMKIHERLGDYPWMIERLEEGGRGGKPSPGTEGRFRKAFREEGPAGYWRVLIEDVEAAKDHSPYMLAQYYTELGDSEAALNHLSQAVDAHEFMVFFACRDAVFDPLRTAPRFQALLHRVCGPENR